MSFWECRLNEAGITIDQLPQNWEEFTETLEKIRIETEKPPFILAPTWFGWLFEAFVRQSGGALSNERNTEVQFNQPAAIEALTYWKMLQDRGLMERSTRSWRSVINGFSNGLYPIIYYSSAGMSQLSAMESEGKLRFEWMTDIMPKNQIYSTPVGAANLFISNYMTEAEENACWKLIKFFLKPNIQAQISYQSGYFPVVQTAFDDPILKDLYSREQFNRARKQLDFASAKIMTRNYPEIRKILRAAIDRTLDKGMSPGDSLNMAQFEAQQLLSRPVE